MGESNNKIICPDCEAIIEMNVDTAVGDILECSECGTEVELLSKDPLKYSELTEQK
ncbi:MAG: lysine biosynthesis protein LysW [Candidatus Shapirobacteria bacterium]|jgi:alpha-aminoadipate carrier protein LysW|nr:lysine biosynthesis protein LysW [Candidatus Shapirobacteria bacterium]